MKYLKQLLTVLAFSLAGELLQHLIPLPIPAAIYGFLLLFAALCFGLLKPEKIADTAQFLIGILPVLFVAPVVNILGCYELIAPHLIPICVIIGVSTFLVFAVTGFVTQKLSKKRGDDRV